ncbi:MAG: helix-turn-helix domain-containing protein [Sphingomonadaceae bacterium]
MLSSHNYAPAADLAPYVRNHFVFRAPLPVDMELVDDLLSETAMIRILLQGDWAAAFAPGAWASEGPTILFGANTRCFKVRVRGPFVVVGSAIRPCGWASLFTHKADAWTDRMVPLAEGWGDDAAAALYRDVADADDDTGVVAALEHGLRARLHALGTRSIDPAMAAFETLANNDSTARVADAATTLDLSIPALNRRCLATFGLTPKAILRRSRFLDMASVLRAISNPGEHETAALRFADQSHLNREFRYFVNMTPGEFKRASTPLLNAVLTLRAERNA